MLDFASHIAHLFVTIVDFIVLTFIAIDASEEAMRCHDIVRRHGLINCDSEEERNFVSPSRQNFRGFVSCTQSPFFFIVDKEYVVCW